MKGPLPLRDPGREHATTGGASPEELDLQTVEKLQDLIRVNIDSIQGLEEAARSTDDRALSGLLRELASERQDHVMELRRHVLLNDEEPVRHGSFRAAMHRMWMDLRAAVSGGRPAAVLKEVERGEAAIQGVYEQTLAAASDSPVAGVLRTQYGRVLVGREQVRQLREASDR